LGCSGCAIVVPFVRYFSNKDDNNDLVANNTLKSLKKQEHYHDVFAVEA